MKVTTYVDLGSKEIEVDVTAEDIWSEFRIQLSEPENRHELMRALNRLNDLFGKMPESLISDLSPQIRTVASNFFAAQADRFRPPQP